MVEKFIGQSNSRPSGSFPIAGIASISLGAALVPAISFACSSQISKVPWLYRLLWIGSFLLNVVSVSIPGRFDSQGEQSISWETAFAPAGYAFAIWGIIYVGELFIALYSGLWGQPIGLLQASARWWIMGNLFQSLWCAAFRPIFRSALWLPSSLLALSAASYFMLHAEITSSLSSSYLPFWSKIGLWALRFPISLHTGWLTAATLLNINGWATVSNLSMGKQIALAIASAYVAAIGGICVTVWKKDPFIGLTVAWALAAVALQTRKYSKLDLTDYVKDALATTEANLARLLVGVAVSIPVISKIF